MRKNVTESRKTLLYFRKNILNAKKYEKKTKQRKYNCWTNKNVADLGFAISEKCQGMRKKFQDSEDIIFEIEL